MPYMSIEPEKLKISCKYICMVSLLKKSKKYTSSFQYGHTQTSHTGIQRDMNTMLHCINCEFLLLFFIVKNMHKVRFPERTATF